MKKLIKLQQEFLFEFIKLFLSFLKDRKIKLFLSHLLILIKNYYKYLKLVINENYKYLFDSNFRNQVKKINKSKQLRNRMYKAFKALQWIELELSKMGLNRHQRRQFWEDFRKRGQVRNEVFNKLLERYKGE